MAGPGTTRFAWCAAVCAVVLAFDGATSGDEPSGTDALAKAILDKSNVVGGICSLPIGDADLAFALARHKRLVVHVLQPAWESVLANRREAAAMRAGATARPSAPVGGRAVPDSAVGLPHPIEADSAPRIPNV